MLAEATRTPAMLLLPPTLTEREARDTLRMLRQAMDRESGQQQVVIDAAPLSRFDSSALAVLLECRRLAQATGRSFAVRNTPMRLSQMAKLYGVDGLVLQAPQVAAAAAAPVAAAPAASQAGPSAAA
jgi:phospholipid transport system transporter-binding protein